MPTAHTSAPPPPPSLIVSLLSPFLRQLKRRVAIHGPYGFVQLSVSSCQALSPSPPLFLSPSILSTDISIVFVTVQILVQQQFQANPTRSHSNVKTVASEFQRS